MPAQPFLHEDRWPRRIQPDGNGGQYLEGRREYQQHQCSHPFDNQLDFPLQSLPASAVQHDAFANRRGSCYSAWQLRITGI